MRFVTLAVLRIQNGFYFQILLQKKLRLYDVDLSNLPKQDDAGNSFPNICAVLEKERNLFHSSSRISVMWYMEIPVRDSELGRTSEKKMNLRKKNEEILDGFVSKLVRDPY